MYIEFLTEIKFLHDVETLDMPASSEFQTSKKEDLFLVAYVDDFKLSGPRESLADAWQQIFFKIILGDVE